MTLQATFPRAILLDFYGTVVEEDDAPIADTCARIADVSPLRVRARAISSYWGRMFRQLCSESYGRAFRSQREIERLSLERVLREFQADLDLDHLLRPQYRYWAHPSIYRESKDILARCSIPVCLVSNIDNADLRSALAHNDLSFDMVVTSEDCRAYKPRGEMFKKALSLLGLSPGEVLHVGDSLAADVRGAKAQGIPVLWINRLHRDVPHGQDAPEYTFTDLRGLLDMLPAGD